MSKTERYQVFDEHDKFIRWADTQEAYDLVVIKKQAENLWHGDRIFAVRYLSKDPLPQRPVALRRRGFGDSHRHETEQNPPNVWTIDYLAGWGRLECLRVLEQCRPAAQLIPRPRARKIKRRAA